MITELYTVHSTEILRYCISLCGGTGFAEDLLQETFLRALSNLDTLEELAQQYGLSPAGVRSALSRARRLLREKLARQ